MKKNKLGLKQVTLEKEDSINIMNAYRKKYYEIKKKIERKKERKRKRERKRKSKSKRDKESTFYRPINNSRGCHYSAYLNHSLRSRTAY